MWLNMYRFDIEDNIIQSINKKFNHICTKFCLRLLLREGLEHLLETQLQHHLQL